MTNQSQPAWGTGSGGGRVCGTAKMCELKEFKKYLAYVVYSPISQARKLRDREINQFKVTTKLEIVCMYGLDTKSKFLYSWVFFP
jgi:hypothetical protein